jgi:hypothetical protein
MVVISISLLVNIEIRLKELVIIKIIMTKTVAMITLISLSSIGQSEFWFSTRLNS